MGDNDRLRKYFTDLDNVNLETSDYLECDSPERCVILDIDLNNDGLDEIFVTAWYGRPAGSIIRLIERRGSEGCVILEQEEIGDISSVEVIDFPIIEDIAYKTFVLKGKACYGTGMGCDTLTLFTYIDGVLLKTWFMITNYNESNAYFSNFEAKFLKQMCDVEFDDASKQNIIVHCNASETVLNRETGDTIELEPEDFTNYETDEWTTEYVWDQINKVFSKAVEKDLNCIRNIDKDIVEDNDDLTDYLVEIDNDIIDAPHPFECFNNGACIIIEEDFNNDGDKEILTIFFYNRFIGTMVRLLEPDDDDQYCVLYEDVISTTIASQDIEILDFPKLGEKTYKSIVLPGYAFGASGSNSLYLNMFTYRDNAFYKTWFNIPETLSTDYEGNIAKSLAKNCTIDFMGDVIILKCQQNETIKNMKTAETIEERVIKEWEERYIWNEEVKLFEQKIID